MLALKMFTHFIIEFLAYCHKIMHPNECQSIKFPVKLLMDRLWREIIDAWTFDGFLVHYEQKKKVWDENNDNDGRRMTLQKFHEAKVICMNKNNYENIYLHISYSFNYYMKEKKSLNSLVLY